MAKGNSRLMLKDIKVGDIYRLKSNTYTSQYGYEVGDQVIVTYKSGNGISIQDVNRTKIQVGVIFQDLEASILNKEEIQAKINKLEEQIQVQKDMIAWMDATKSEVYDEMEFKVWNTLKALNSKSTDIEKSRIIAKLIKG